MNARQYLNARRIPYKEPTDTKIGRLTISSEFTLLGERGVVIRPKRGSVSERYLSLLAEDGVKYVIADTGMGVSFYGIDAETGKLAAWRSLPAGGQRHFPSKEVWDALADLLWRSQKRETHKDLAAHILRFRIRDEKKQNFERWDAAVNLKRAQTPELLAGFDPKIISLTSDSKTETLLSICAMISGFRLTPRNDNELALILEWLGKSENGKQHFHGLPRSLSFIFETAREGAQHLEVATTAIGSQLLGLNGVPESRFSLEWEDAELCELLETLFPSARRISEKYLSDTPSNAPERIFLVPPFGWMPADQSIRKTIKPLFTDKGPMSKIPSEYAYILHAIERVVVNGIIIAVVSEGILSNASHTAFRSRLLEQCQLLGVFSLPPGHCFEGVALRCSLVFLKKREQIPEDYSIQMLELSVQDLENHEVRKEVAMLIHQMLSEEAQV